MLMRVILQLGGNFILFFVLTEFCFLYYSFIFKAASRKRKLEQSPRENSDDDDNDDQIAKKQKADSVSVILSLVQPPECPDF